jgi:hypothetical protein
MRKRMFIRLALFCGKCSLLQSLFRTTPTCPGLSRQWRTKERCIERNKTKVFFFCFTFFFFFEKRPVIPSGTPLSLVSLMQDCWRAAYDQRPTFIEICDRLDVVVVRKKTNKQTSCGSQILFLCGQIDAAIRDPQGNAFWKRAFQKQERVSFDEFARVFYPFLGLVKPEEVGCIC